MTVLRVSFADTRSRYSATY